MIDIALAVIVIGALIVALAGASEAVPATRKASGRGLAASASTPGAGWQAARWPVIDLQPQRVWLELTVRDGAALWAFFKFGGTGFLKSLAKKSKWYVVGIAGATWLLEGDGLSLLVRLGHTVTGH